MKTYWRYAGILALITAVAGGVLAATYHLTESRIRAGENQAGETALAEIFFSGYAKNEKHTAATGEIYYAIYYRADDPIPDFFAINGEGIGYNRSSPITAIVAFVNPQKNAVELPGGERYLYNSGELICAGWKIIASQETPGLGENARAHKTKFTWFDYLRGKPHKNSADRRTDFQRQFAGKGADSLAVKKNVDIITGATYTTDGVVAAIKNASLKLRAELADLKSQSNREK